jgi:alpha-mannosidase
MAVPALEARNPLQVIAAENSTGKLPAEQKGIELSRKGIIVTAFGEDADGNKGTLLRVWEMVGNGGTVGINLPAHQQASKATPVNLRGEVNGKPIRIINGKLNCSIKAFGPASFILE